MKRGMLGLVALALAFWLSLGAVMLGMDAWAQRATPDSSRPMPTGRLKGAPALMPESRVKLEPPREYVSIGMMGVGDARWIEPQFVNVLPNREAQLEAKVCAYNSRTKERWVLVFRIPTGWGIDIGAVAYIWDVNKAPWLGGGPLGPEEIIRVTEIVDAPPAQAGGR